MTGFLLGSSVRTVPRIRAKRCNASRCSFTPSNTHPEAKKTLTSVVATRRAVPFFIAFSPTRAEGSWFVSRSRRCTIRS